MYNKIINTVRNLTEISVNKARKIFQFYIKMGQESVSFIIQSCEILSEKCSIYCELTKEYVQKILNNIPPALRLVIGENPLEWMLKLIFKTNKTTYEQLTLLPITLALNNIVTSHRVQKVTSIIKEWIIKLLSFLGHFYHILVGLALFACCMLTKNDRKFLKNLLRKSKKILKEKQNKRSGRKRRHEDSSESYSYNAYRVIIIGEDNQEAPFDFEQDRVIYRTGILESESGNPCIAIIVKRRIYETSSDSDTNSIL